MLQLFEVVIDVSLDDECVTDIVHELIKFGFVVVASLVLVVGVLPQTVEEEVRFDDVVGDSIQGVIHLGHTKRD